MDIYFYKGPDSSLKTRLYDKRDDFDFTIVNYPFMSSNIPISPSYGVYTSRLVAFCRACSEFSDFKERHMWVAKKLIKQGYQCKRLKKAFTRFTQRHGALVSKYNCDRQAHMHNILGKVYFTII